jgi:hypothetical protein
MVSVNDMVANVMERYDENRVVPPHYRPLNAVDIELALRSTDVDDPLKIPEHYFGAPVQTRINRHNRIEYGYVTQENDEGKWDWWVIGGRWSGRLRGYDITEDPENYVKCEYCNGTGSRPGSTGIVATSFDKGIARLFPVIGTGCNACYGTGMMLPMLVLDQKGDWCNVADIVEDFVPYAVIDPYGEWEECGEDAEAWKERWKAIREHYKDGHIAILVDYHS